MAWETTKVENLRLQLIEAYINGKVKMSALCAQYKISRKTGYKWINRYLEYGLEGLKDFSKAPKKPNQIYSNDIFDKIIDEKSLRPKWGPKKILAVLKKKHPELNLPSISRISKFFKIQGLVKPRRIKRRVPAVNPLGELNDSNDVWIIDFKGWFYTGDKQKCEPLTITDGFSRYLIRCVHLPRKNAENVWQVLVGAFQEFGLPKRIRSDNGPPFGCTGVGRLTQLSINLIKAGITPEWINPGCPQENGRHERFHLTLKQEAASPPAKTISQQILRMNGFQDTYNFERPHEALNMDTPSNRYILSKNKWDGILKSPDYDENMLIRKVCPNGCIWIKKIHFYLGQILVGEPIGLKQVNDDDYEVFYGSLYLGKICNNQFERAERPKRFKEKTGALPQTPGKILRPLPDPYSELNCQGNDGCIKSLKI